MLSRKREQKHAGKGIAFELKEAIEGEQTAISLFHMLEEEGALSTNYGGVDIVSDLNLLSFVRSTLWVRKEKGFLKTL